MADLIVNVWLRRHLYGPGNLPPEDLWSEVPAEAWDEVPERFCTPPAADGAGGTESDGAPASQPPPLLDQLGRLPDDKDILCGFAEAHGVEVDRRKGPAKLREDLQAALTERMP